MAQPVCWGRLLLHVLSARGWRVETLGRQDGNVLDLRFFCSPVFARLRPMWFLTLWAIPLWTPPKTMPKLPASLTGPCRMRWRTFYTLSGMGTCSITAQILSFPVMAKRP